MSLNEIGMVNVAGKMTLAQMSEVGFMLMIPFCLRKLGVKAMLLTGMVAWTVRFILFAVGSNSDLVVLFYIGILLHGVCYDFFYVTAQIYMDAKAPAHLRASVQGFFTLLTFGAGWLVGSLLNGAILQAYQITDAAAQVIGHDWKSAMMVPAFIALLAAAVFALFFKETKVQETRPDPVMT
jgi:MFS family permease